MRTWWGGDGEARSLEAQSGCGVDQPTGNPRRPRRGRATAIPTRQSWDCGNAPTMKSARFLRRMVKSEVTKNRITPKATYPIKRPSTIVTSELHVPAKRFFLIQVGRVAAVGHRVTSRRRRLKMLMMSEITRLKVR